MTIDEKFMIDREALHEAICQAYRSGVRDFYSGLAKYVDTAGSNLSEGTTSCNYADGFIDDCLDRMDRIQEKLDKAKNTKLEIVPDEEDEF